jgi:hypothetical protein
MKGSALVGLLVVAVVAFAAGWYLHQSPPPVQTVGGGHPKAATIWKVVDTIDGNNSCQQLNSAGGGFAKLPQLYPGDSITWVKGIAPGGGSAALVITFPQKSNGHIGTPFVYPNGQPNFVFHDGDNSGPPGPGVPADVYLYESMTIGGTACTNPQDPGVIIDK